MSDTVLVISTQTHRDLATFAAEHSIAMPAVECIPLPSSLIAMSPVRPTTLPSDVDQIGFALFVSTITARKNHHLLLDVWTRLLTDDARPVPFLVFAGSRGSLSDETMNRIQRDRRLARRVIHLEGLADAEIASEIYSTAGGWDLLVKFYLKEDDDVGQFVSNQIQTIPGIRDTYTLITFKAF